MVHVVRIEHLPQRQVSQLQLLGQLYEGLHDSALDRLWVELVLKALFLLESVVRFEGNTVLSESSLELIEGDGAAVVSIQLFEYVPEFLDGQLAIDLLHEPFELAEVHFLLSVEAELFD